LSKLLERLICWSVEEKDVWALSLFFVLFPLFYSFTHKELSGFFALQVLSISHILIQKQDFTGVGGYEFKLFVLNCHSWLFTYFITIIIIF